MGPVSSRFMIPAIAALALAIGAVGAEASLAPSPPVKNYSQNGATGDFAPAVHGSVPVVRVVHVEQNGFEWGDAALGAGTALLLLMAGAVTIHQVRRRRVSPPSPARPAAV